MISEKLQSHTVTPHYFCVARRVDSKRVDFRGPEANKDSHDGLGVFGEEVLRAARSLASLEWRVIREERFHVTPIGAQQTSILSVMCMRAARAAHVVCPGSGRAVRILNQIVSDR